MILTQAEGPKAALLETLTHLAPSAAPLAPACLDHQYFQDDYYANIRTTYLSLVNWSTPGSLAEMTMTTVTWMTVPNAFQTQNCQMKTKGFCHLSACSLQFISINLILDIFDSRSSICLGRYSELLLWQFTLIFNGLVFDTQITSDSKLGSRSTKQACHVGIRIKQHPTNETSVLSEMIR